MSFALEIAKRSPDLDAKTQGNLDRGIRTLQRIGQLVDGLLLFALSGKPRPEAPGANVAEVLGGVVEDMKPQAEAHEIAIAYEPPDPDTMVACTPGVLVSMASNVLGNAIKYMGDAPVREVEVRVRQVRNAVRVEVRDTGPGVPAALRSRVFDPYLRGAESTIAGLGLGLATVRRLAEAHEGEVGVESSIGSGAPFGFSFPSGGRTARAKRPALRSAPSKRQGRERHCP